MTERRPEEVHWVPQDPDRFVAWGSDLRLYKVTILLACSAILRRAQINYSAAFLLGFFVLSHSPADSEIFSMRHCYCCWMLCTIRLLFNHCFKIIEKIPVGFY
jgi:hypothetical protein